MHHRSLLGATAATVAVGLLISVTPAQALSIDFTPDGTGVATALNRIMTVNGTGAVTATRSVPRFVAQNVVAIGAGRVAIGGESSADNIRVSNNDGIRVLTGNATNGPLTRYVIPRRDSRHDSLLGAFAANTSGTIALIDASTLPGRIVWLKTPRATRFTRIATLATTGVPRGSAIAVGPRGDILAAWESGDHVLRARYRNTAGRWGTVQRLGRVMRANIVAQIGSDGRQYLAWYDRGGVTGGFATAATGRPLGTPITFTAADRSGHRPAQLALETGTRGRAVLAYTGAWQGRTVVWMSRIRDARLDTPQLVSPAGTPAQLSSLAVAPSGQTFIVYRTGAGDFGVASTSTGTAFGAPTLLARAGEPFYTAAAAIDPVTLIPVTVAIGEDAPVTVAGPPIT